MYELMTIGEAATAMLVKDDDEGTDDDLFNSGNSSAEVTRGAEGSCCIVPARTRDKHERFVGNKINSPASLYVRYIFDRCRYDRFLDYVVIRPFFISACPFFAMTICMY